MKDTDSTLPLDLLRSEHYRLQLGERAVPEELWAAGYTPDKAHQDGRR